MYNIICNPVAGKGKTQKLLAELTSCLDARRIDYTVFRSESAGHATVLARRLARESGDGALICMGGDGTLHEIIEGIEDFDGLKLGIIACGTGNDFAKTLGLPVGDIPAALDVILSGKSRAVDYIQLEDHRAHNVTGMGIDADVLERQRRAKVFKGKTGYYLSLIRTLFSFKWNRYEVRIDGGEPVKHTAMITAVCNGKYFGGGMLISPESDPSDGVLNVIIVNRISRLRIPFALMGFFTGKLLSFPFVTQYKCERVEFITDARPVINADGELIYGKSFSCGVEKGKLNILVP